MKSILKATAMLSSASAITIVMGLISAKFSAVFLGPSGMGYMGLLQSLLGLSVMIAAMGAGVGLVRAGAAAIAARDREREATLRAGAWLLYCVFGCSVLLTLALLRKPLAQLMLGSIEHEGAAVAVAAGVLLTMAAGLLASTLNAHHRVTELARVTMLNSILTVAVGVFIIWRWRATGIIWAVLAGCLVNWLVSLYYVSQRAPRPRVHVPFREALKSARSLLAFGAPYTASMIAGSGVVLALPVLVLHNLGTEQVGFYRAAATISVNYLGFLLTSMAQDYYPRVCAVSDQPRVLERLINEQHRLLLLIGGPVILAMLAVVPYLISLVYSPRFIPAAALLEWQLIGDIFRFAAWTMSFVILARSGGLVFFLVESTTGVTLLLLSWLGIHWFGLEGLGMGFVACAMVNYFICLFILRRDIKLKWTRANLTILLVAILAGTLIRILPYVGMERLRTPLALLLAALAAAFSMYIIWGQVGGLRGLFGRGSPLAADGAIKLPGPPPDGPPPEINSI